MFEPHTAISRSNNTNKYNPQEQGTVLIPLLFVQIIQINSILKNIVMSLFSIVTVQIIQINSILKNNMIYRYLLVIVQIIQINSILKNRHRLALV